MPSPKGDASFEAGSVLDSATRYSFQFKLEISDILIPWIIGENSPYSCLDH